MDMSIPFHVLVESTEGFSDTQMIGSGGHGKVYKGVHNGEDIAVKMFYDVPALVNKQFENEFFIMCQHLSRIKHPNIVRFVGYCYETQHKPDEHHGIMAFCQYISRILCFELLQGGSLDKYLNESRDHDWPTCYNIIKGTCEGLNFLHGGCESQILHLDLKPSNILLDKNMGAKVANFGLSKIFGDTHTHITNRTIGTDWDYMPPEFICRKQISPKNDVYSLGVIIIDIVAGHSGYLEFREMDDVTALIKQVIMNWREWINATTSPCPSAELDQVETCIKIAIKCVDIEKKNRPTVAEILDNLQETEKRFHLLGQSLPTPTESGPRGGWGDTVRDISGPQQARSGLPSSGTPSASGSQMSGSQLMRTAPVIQNIGTIDSLSASQVRPGEIFGPQLPRSGLPSSGTPSASSSQMPGSENIGTNDSFSASQVRPGEISGPQQPRSGLPSSGTPSASGSQMSGSQMRSKPHYSLQHLKDITNNFSEERILGKGGSGVVYKGLLANGKMIAVKKVEQRWSSKEQCEIFQKQFENEVNLLMGLKHPNIVELVGYCYEMQHVRLPHNGSCIFCWQIYSLLCLEFLSEGSLDKHISDATSGLDWHTRYKIIEGISYGLQYLHEQSDVPIIHMDLKPANILLDANMVPKIADFGISRLFDQGQTIHTKTTNGTPGYMPPEFTRGIITLMSDIFSLGVIIMEVIMGHKAYPDDIQASSGEFTNTELQKWRNVLEKEPWNTNIETDCQQIGKCIQIGLMCVNPDRTKRPTIRTITNMLQDNS